ncbi:polyribonucleotide nucleotidyltransferase [Pelolinea submarina]|uniref:Polyribonucleotide nucleotidyltransferase n=1 Tax=Pelolinea submarina TaxID=913107 RepID=A0A347ZV97_9CHLR|nr:polyribonucleotide nucleotidyltransferase [Pelolinea submarina]REG10186.1 polyribonucleotide nucleotidyltransferase [Pelolinea submarina]BBB49228.1 polyribonucleotide nucleotidyltransferase [Pelolinea submarina]
MEPQGKQFTTVVGNQTITFETGKLAGQSNGAVTIRVGDSVIFASAVMSNNTREGIDFFPLSVEYEERLYAGGRIPGSFFRREGRPDDEAVLTARLTDRPLRPLFDQNMRNEVQIMSFPISADFENMIDIMVVNAASAALTISDIPWAGPVGAVRIGRVDGEFVINPTFEQLAVSNLDLRVAGTRDAILMVESGSDETSEDDMIAAITLAHEAIQPLVDVQEKMAAEVGKAKRVVEIKQPDQNLFEKVYGSVKDGITALLDKPHLKAELDEGIHALEEETVVSLAGEDESLVKAVKEAFEEAYKKVVRDRIMEKGLRPDGRGTSDIRRIWCEVGTSPRAHGSGLFTRGETQVLTLATLGTPKEAQELDNLGPNDTKRYIHHYNFPDFSVGEVGRPRRSRREVGHGALAERALVAVLPDEKEFPYTMRLVSEVLSSNGSTSQASICGSTLALMDTGVPIKAPVAGIAMGLIKEGENYKILTDIQGLEDHLGDMDFKVAGTEVGITALQMDIKIKGITPQIMSEALAQAKEARLYILSKIIEAIPAPRSELKSFVPRIVTVQIPVEKIGAVIGPGGKMIRALQEETNTHIDIGEDGTVFIAAVDKKDEDEARDRIMALTESPVLGRIYTGKVVRVADFGAFVEIMPGTDGMVHISQLDTERVEKVEDVAQVGDDLTVMITNIDGAGKIRLSRQAVLEGWTVEEAQEHDNANRKSSGDRGGRSGGNRGGRSGGNRGGYSGNRDRH